MRTVKTVFGDVTITNVSMDRVSFNDKYIVSIELEFEGKKNTIVFHSNDSMLFDKLSNFAIYDERSAYLLTKFYFIKDCIEDYINSL